MTTTTKQEKTEQFSIGDKFISLAIALRDLGFWLPTDDSAIEQDEIEIAKDIRNELNALIREAQKKQPPKGANNKIVL